MNAQVSLLGSRQGFINSSYRNEGYVAQGVLLCAFCLKMNAVIHYVLWKWMLHSGKLPLSSSCFAVAQGSLVSVVLCTTWCLAWHRSRQQGRASPGCHTQISLLNSVFRSPVSSGECIASQASVSWQLGLLWMLLSQYFFLNEIWFVAKTDNSTEVYPFLQHFSWEDEREIGLFSLLVKYFFIMCQSESHSICFTVSCCAIIKNISTNIITKAYQSIDSYFNL